MLTSNRNSTPLTLLSPSPATAEPISARITTLLDLDRHRASRHQDAYRQRHHLQSGLDQHHRASPFPFPLRPETTCSLFKASIATAIQSRAAQTALPSTTPARTPSPGQRGVQRNHVPSSCCQERATSRFTTTRPTSASTFPNWRIDGVDFTFPEGTIILPNSYLVVVEDPFIFAAHLRPLHLHRWHFQRIPAEQRRKH